MSVFRKTISADSNVFQRESEDDYDPGMSAMTDMVFQLLMVFILGIGGSSALMQQFRFDRSPVQGQSQPDRISRYLSMQVVMQGKGKDGVVSYKVILDASPALGPKEEWEVSGEDALMEALLACSVRAKALAAEHSDYGVKRVFLAPASIEYRDMLTAYVKLDELTKSTWLVSMYEDSE